MWLWRMVVRFRPRYLPHLRLLEVKTLHLWPSGTHRQWGTAYWTISIVTALVLWYMDLCLTVSKNFVLYWEWEWADETLDTFKFRGCKSVQHHTFNWINQRDAATSQVYYLSLIIQLDAFRASSCPSSGATTTAVAASATAVVASDYGHEDARNMLNCI